MFGNASLGLLASAIAHLNVLSTLPQSILKPLLPGTSSRTASSSVSFSPTCQVLGPFQIGTREAAWPSSDPLEWLGGFHALEYDPSAEFLSSLTPNGTVTWSQTQLLNEEAILRGLTVAGARGEGRQSARGSLHVSFPGVDWTGLQAIYGWAALQYQAWARGSIRVQRGSLDKKQATVPVVLYADRVLELRVDNIAHFGGDFYAFRRAPLVLWLKPGQHRIDLRLVRDVRAMGGALGKDPLIQVDLEAAVMMDGNGHAPLISIAEDYENASHGAVLPDLLEDIGRLSSNLGSVAIRNCHRDWISIWDVSSTDDAFDVSLLAKDHVPVGLAPGQSRPLPFVLDLDHRGGNATTLSIKLGYTTGTAESYRQDETRHTAFGTFAMRLSKSRYEPHKFTFMHPSEIVSYAILRPPARNASCPFPNQEEKLPVMLNLHGAGLEADSALVAHALDPLPRLCAWVLFPTGVTPWSADDWHNWGFADVEAAIAAIPSWIEHTAWNGPGVDRNQWLVSGHSNGGQGVWYASTHRPDKTIAAAPVSGYLSIGAYVPDQLWNQADPLLTRVIQTTLNDYKHELLAGNLAGVPIFQQHGSGDDNVPVYHSRRMHELIKQTDWQSEYYELPGAPHWFDGVMTTDRLSAFYEEHLDRKSSVPELPLHFSFVIANPATMGSKGGIVVDQLISPDRYGRIDVTIDPKRSAWDLKTSNIRRFHMTSGHPSQRPGATLLIDGRGAALQIEAFDTGESWYVQSGDGSWKWSTDAAWRSRMQRYGRQSGTMDAFLNSRGRFILTHHGKSTADHAVDVSRQLYQYFGADCDIVDRSLTQHSQMRSSREESGNMVTLALGAPGAHAIRCNADQDQHFCIQVHVEDGKKEEEAFRIEDSSGHFHVCSTGSSSAAIFLRPLEDERLELVIWGKDLEGLQRASRLIPSLTGVGQPDFTILEGLDVKAAGLFDYAWRVSPGSFISCGLSP